jgi:predicted XRE-type DNA-binding protein
MAKSVFYDIADTPGEATNLTARSLLMIAIEQKIHENGWTQAKAAAALGVQQPRVSDLMNGKIEKFSLDALVNMLPTVGLTFSVQPAQPKKSPPVRLFVADKSPRRTRVTTTQTRARRRTGAGDAAAAVRKVAVAANTTKSAVMRSNPKGTIRKKSK